MRKFKLRDQAAERMQGISKEVIQSSEKEKKTAGQGKLSAGKQVCSDFRVISRTDTGLIRKNNQDTVILGCGLMGIADGMGGHNGGETASLGARDGLFRELEGKQPDIQTLEAAVKTVNSELYQEQLNDEKLAGMGTTLTVLWPTDEKMLVAHVGDSRAYLLRSGKLRQMTNDHSLVGDMVRRGILTEEQAACHPMRNYITRAIGTEDDIDADILAFERETGDRWLVCSDGLHGLVRREELELLMNQEDLDETADEMIRLALDRGGKDNVSLVIVNDMKKTAEGMEVTE